MRRTFFSSSCFVKGTSGKSTHVTTITCQNYNLYKITGQFEILKFELCSLSLKLNLNFELWTSVVDCEEER